MISETNLPLVDRLSYVARWDHVVGDCMRWQVSPKKESEGSGYIKLKYCAAEQ